MGVGASGGVGELAGVQVQVTLGRFYSGMVDGAGPGQPGQFGAPDAVVEPLPGQGGLGLSALGPSLVVVVPVGPAAPGRGVAGGADQDAVGGVHAHGHAQADGRGVDLVQAGAGGSERVQRGAQRLGRRAGGKRAGQRRDDRRGCGEVGLRSARLGRGANNFACRLARLVSAAAFARSA